jgi:uncharacterized membrane protein
MVVFIYKLLSVVFFIGALVSALFTFPAYDSGGASLFGGLKGYDFFLGLMFIVLALVLLTLSIVCHKKAKKHKIMQRYKLE